MKNEKLGDILYDLELNILRPRALGYTRGNKDDALDLVQVTLEKILINKQAFLEHKNMKAYALTIMKNSFIDKKRKKTEELTVDDENVKLDIVSAETPEEPNNLLDCISKLEDKDQEIIYLVAQEFNSNEIAKKLNIPSGTIRRKKASAFVILKECIGEI